jgi:O-antigen ligase/polysaccharide polymerase Wzy-like membrane protein/exopolysaccharide biosynthesis protein YbjH
MALSINRFNMPTARNSLPFSGLWLAAGLSMVSLSACIYYLLPEESFAIASALLILLIAAADLRYGFLAFVFLYPFMPASWGIDIADWMPYLTAKRLCCLVLALTFLVHGKGAWDTPRVRRVGWFMVALVLLQLAAGIGSHDPLGAIKRTFGDAVEWYFPCVIAAHLFRTKAQMRMLFTLAVTGMAVSAVLAIVEHGLDYNFYDMFVAARDDIQKLLSQATELHRFGTTIRRARVAFAHPIELGLHLMCVLLVAVYLLRQRGVFHKVALAFGMPLLLMALLFTYSRGPMLGLACGMVWLGLVGRGARSLLPVLLLCGLGAYMLMPASARDVLDQTIATTTDIERGDSMGGGTVRARINLLQAGLQYSQQNLWFGLGPGELKEKKEKNGRETIDFSSVDNFYLQVLLRHGVITLTMTLALYIYLLSIFTRGAFKLTDRDAVGLAGIASAMCVANFIALVTVGINITLFWILLGPMVRACDLYQPVTRKKPRGKKSVRRHAFPRPGWPAVDPAAPSTDKEETAAEAPVPVAAGARRWQTLALAMSLAALLVALLPAGAPAAPSFYGTSGLFETPTATAAQHGAWSAGANYVNRDFRAGAASFSSGTVAHSLTVGLIPRVEVAAVLTNWEGRLGTRRLNAGPSADFNLAGYDVDRMVAVHWLALKQNGSRPALAFGVRDVFGTDQPLRAQYGVASWSLTPLGADRPLMLSAGVGTRSLHGPFAGAEFQFDRHASFLLEGMRGMVNGGFRVVPLRNFQLDAAFMGFRSLGGGLSYQRRF